MQNKLGFIGLGDMGRLMATHLLDDHLYVYNRSKEKCEEIVKNGAHLCENPQNVGSQSDIVFLMLKDDEACEEVITGENGLIKNEKALIIVNMSTITAKMSLKLAKECKASNIEYLEAPVSGTLPHARDSNLIILAAGDSTIFSTVNPFLNKMGRVVHYIGEVGSAMKMKLLINSLMAIQTTAIAEILGTAAKNDLDPKKLLEIINDSALGNVISKVKGANMLNNEHHTLFRYKYLIKDLKYSISEFSNNFTPLFEQTLEIYQKGLESEGEKDFSAISNVYM